MFSPKVVFFWGEADNELILSNRRLHFFPWCSCGDIIKYKSTIKHHFPFLLKFKHHNLNSDKTYKQEQQKENNGISQTMIIAFFLPDPGEHSPKLSA